MTGEKLASAWWKTTKLGGHCWRMRVAVEASTKKRTFWRAWCMWLLRIGRPRAALARSHALTRKTRHCIDSVMWPLHGRRFCTCCSLWQIVLHSWPNDWPQSGLSDARDIELTACRLQKNIAILTEVLSVQNCYATVLWWWIKLYIIRHCMSSTILTTYCK